jgi:hypothetical protein
VIQQRGFQSSASASVLSIPDARSGLKLEPDQKYRGYIRCTVTRDRWTADSRAVPTIFDEQVDAFTLATFVSLDGQPGAVAG